MKFINSEPCFNLHTKCHLCVYVNPYVFLYWTAPGRALSEQRRQVNIEGADIELGGFKIPLKISAEGYTDILYSSCPHSNLLFICIALNSWIVKWQALTSRNLIIAYFRTWSLLPSTSIQLRCAPQMELFAGYPGNLRTSTNSICTMRQDRLLKNVLAHFQSTPLQGFGFRPLNWNSGINVSVKAGFGISIGNSNYLHWTVTGTWTAKSGSLEETKEVSLCTFESQM